MIKNKFFSSLTDEEIKEILDKVNRCLGEYKKSNRIIKEDVFKILEMNCKTLYYPIKDDDICGFVYKLKDHKIACINSSIPMEKQVFAAAHELYHILYSDIENGEIVNSEVLDEKIPANEMSKEDFKANKFAAEFLVPEEVFRNELSIRNIKKDFIELKKIVELMDVFLVPYKTLVRRLYEIDYISLFKCNEFLNEEDRKEDKGVMLWQKRLGLCKRNNERTKEIKLDKLVDMSLELYDKGQITYEKLNYLLGLSNLNPSEFNIFEQKYEFPQEDEILRIMEE
ncbi:ImmA/IrrE family metallo-endopeptidase [Clostridium sp.]|uniref:ImmA/IrrE family metallo-endopeptidase n=1 Tax=Clostridium sp. TaxID=1506 RepID=UPI003D6D3408